MVSIEQNRGVRAKAEQAVARRILVLKAMAGDQAAFERLFGLHYRLLLFIIRRLVRDADAADDVSQETWLEIHKGLYQLKDPDAFTAWAARIARNVASRHLRKSCRTAEGQEGWNMMQEGRSDWSRAEEETAALLNQAIDQLSDPHREVVLLKYMQELSYEEIAKLTGNNIGTVRSRLHYAKLDIKGFIRRMRSELLGTSP